MPNLPNDQSNNIEDRRSVKASDSEIGSSLLFDATNILDRQGNGQSPDQAVLKTNRMPVTSYKGISPDMSAYTGDGDVVPGYVGQNLSNRPAVKPYK